MPNKGSVGFEMLIWAVRILLIVVVFALITFVIDYDSSTRTESYSLKQDLLLLRAEYTCFAYKGDSGKIYPGIIDFTKLTKENAGLCFGDNFKINLEYVSGELLNTLEGVLICSGDYKCAEKSFFVLLKNHESKEGILRVTVGVPEER